MTCRPSGKCQEAVGGPPTAVTGPVALPIATSSGRQGASLRARRVEGGGVADVSAVRSTRDPYEYSPDNPRQLRYSRADDEAAADSDFAEH